jgi:hypothetical protein
MLLRRSSLARGFLRECGAGRFLQGVHQMISSSRAVAALAVAGVLVVAGCGGSSGSSGSGSAKTAGSSSAFPKVSTSVADGGAIDSKAVITPVVDAITAAKTGHVLLGGPVTGAEDFELSKGIRADFTVRGATLHLVTAGSLIYMKGLPGITKWLKIDPRGSSAIDRAMSSVGDLTKSSDPGTILRTLGDAKGTKVGAETIAGKPTTHYRFVVSPQAYAKAMGKGTLSNAVKEPIITELWVGQDSLPVKATSTARAAGQSSTSTVQYSDWGKPVQISAPPASEVTTKAPF